MKILFGKHKGKEFSEVPTDYVAWLLAESIIQGPSKKALIEYLLKEKSAELLQAWVDKNYTKRTYVPPVGCYSPDGDGMDYEPGYYVEQPCHIKTDDKDFEGMGGSCDWFLDAYDFPEPF